MKKVVYLFISLLIFAGFTSAMELQGGVKYNVESAREYVQQGQQNNITIQGHSYFDKRDKSINKTVYSYNNYGDIIGITVQYKDKPMAYIYGADNNLKYVDKYDRDVNLYPHRGYRYNLDGQLILTSLTVSKNEQFRFDPSGKLIAHSIDGTIYDENGNVIGTASGR